MKIVNWKDIAELIGIAAIVASLVFVGLQMKQSDKIALSEIYQARTTAVVEWNTSLASNPLALSAFEKSATGHVNDITPIEARSGQSIVIAAMFFFENSQYQHTLGFLPDEHWERARLSLKNTMRDPFWRASILSQKPNLRTSFVAVLNEIERELAAESGNETKPL